MCLYLYKYAQYTQILCKQKLLFWMRITNIYIYIYIYICVYVCVCVCVCVCVYVCLCVCALVVAYFTQIYHTLIFHNWSGIYHSISQDLTRLVLYLMRKEDNDQGIKVSCDILCVKKLLVTWCNDRHATDWPACHIQLKDFAIIIILLTSSKSFKTVYPFIFFIQEVFASHSLLKFHGSQDQESLTRSSKG